MGAVFFILSVSYAIFSAAREAFISKGTEAGNWVAWRILCIEVFFFSTWIMQMVMYALSGEASCVASESVVIPIVIVLDLVQKNLFGLAIWSTFWNFLGGTWNPDR